MWRLARAGRRHGDDLAADAFDDQAADNPAKVDALATLGRGILDYTTFQLITEYVKGAATQEEQDLLGEMRDRVLEMRIANRRAEMLLSAGEVERASRFSREAMEIVDVEEATDVDKCHIIGVRLRCLSLMGQLGEARRLHEMARPIAARVPVVQRQSYLSGIAFLAVLGGDPERALPELPGQWPANTRRFFGRVIAT